MQTILQNNLSSFQNFTNFQKDKMAQVNFEDYPICCGRCFRPCKISDINNVRDIPSDLKHVMKPDDCVGCISVETLEKRNDDRKKEQFEKVKSDSSYSYVKLPDGFGVFHRFRKQALSSSPPIVKEKLVMMKRASKIAMKLSKQEPECLSDEEFDALLTEYRSYDAQELAAQQAIVHHYRNFRRNLALISNDKEITLVCADSDDEPCLNNLDTFVKVLTKIEKSDLSHFSLWLIRYVDAFGDIYTEVDDFIGLILHPDLWHFVLGATSRGNLSITNLIHCLQFERTEKVDIDDPSLNTKMQIQGLKRAISGLRISVSALDKGLLYAMQSNNILRIDNIRKQLKSTEENLRRKEILLAALTKIEVAHPSMDMQPNEVENVNDQATNTAVATTSHELVSILTDSPPTNEYVDEVITDVPHQFPGFTDRWINFRRTTLDRAFTKGSLVDIIHLPADFVIPHWKNPSVLPFQSHEFFSGSMTLKLQWNIPKSNQFFVISGYVYHWLQRDRRNELVNPWSISQMPGGRLNGHVANSTEIKIPFMSYLPAIPIRPNSTALNLYYVTLFVMSLTDFEVSTGGVSTAELIYNIKFNDDLKFFGQREVDSVPPTFTVPVEPPEPATPSMMTAAATATALKNDTVRNVKGSLIRTANSVVRTGVSAAVGILNRTAEAAVSKVIPSRRQNRDKPNDLQNMALHQRTVSNIASGSGNFASETFRLQETGSTPHPEFLFGTEKFSSIKPIIETEGFVNSFRIPLTAAAETSIARLTVNVAPPFPSAGGTLFPSAPNFLNWTPVDHMGAWFANYHGKLHFRFECVVDGFKTFRLRIAYFPNSTTANNPTYAESLSVYNRIFDVGADLDTALSFDFEVPYIHGSLNYNYLDTNKVRHAAGLLVIYVETPINQQENLVPGFDLLVFKRAVPNQMLFSVPIPNRSILSVTDTGSIPVPPTPPPGLVWNPLRLNVTFSDFAFAGTLWSCTVTVVSPFDTWSRVIGTTQGAQGTSLSGASFYRSVFNANFISSSFQLQFTPITPAANVNVRMSFLFVGVGTENFERLANSTGTFAFDLDYNGSNPTFNPTFIEEARASMDHRELETDVVDLVGPFDPLGPGIHGEDHMSLQDNMRRFEQWHSLVLDLPISEEPIRVLTLPCNFGAPVFRNGLPRKLKGNKMIHLHDAMRFSRGSLRFVVAFNGLGVNRPVGTFVIVHRPQVVDYPFTTALQVAPAQYNDLGYGETIVSLQQNNVVCLEVPMYVPNLGILNASYDSNEYLTSLSQGLGTLDFYYTGPSNRFSVQIKRAFGDDTMMYGFNGFPVRTQAETEPGIAFSIPELAKPSVDIDLIPKETRDKINDAADGITNLTSLMSDFTEKLTSNVMQREILMTIVLQISQIINNPTATTFALSLGQILVNLRLISFDFVSTLNSKLEKVWGIIIEAVRPSMNGSEASVDEDIDTLADLTGTLLTGITSFFGVKSASKLSFSERISTSFTYGASVHMRIVEFVKSILNFAKKAVVFVCNKFFPESKLLGYLKDGSIELWIQRVQVVTDATVATKILNSAKNIAVVYKLVKQGEDFNFRLAKRNGKSGLSRLVSSLLFNLKKLRDRIGITSHVPVSQPNPFCYYLFGESQIGKSELLKDVSLELMAASYPELIVDNLIFVAPETEKYWSKYYTQPVIHFDDFGRLPREESTEEDLARLCGLKSGAPFVVPKPFEDKGLVSVARLIGCASNIDYPVINGLKHEVGWNRRDVVYKVTVDFTDYPTCALHEGQGFALTCKDCIGLISDDRLKVRRDFRFELKPSHSAKNFSAAPNKLTYEEFLIDIKRRHATYVVECDKFAQEQKIKIAKIMGREIGEFAVPVKSWSDLADIVTDEDFEDVIEELGGLNSPAKASMLFDPLFRWWYGDEDADVEDLTIQYLDDELSCDHSTVEGRIPVFGKDCYYWPNTELSNLPCSQECDWPIREASYLRQWYSELKEKGTIPKGFPKRYDEDYLERVRRTVRSEIEILSKYAWADNLSKVLAVLSSALLLVGGFMMFKNLWDKPKVVSLTDPDATVETYALEEIFPHEMPQHGHPALEVSGDVKTKFASKVKSRGKRPALKAINAKPSQELASVEQAFLKIQQATITMSAENAGTARCLHLGKGVYFTQLHAFCTITVQTANKLMDLFNKRTCCNSGCVPYKGTPNALGAITSIVDQRTRIHHSPECVAQTNALRPIVLEKKDSSGCVHRQNIRLCDIFAQNSQFMVDSNGNDFVLFRMSLKGFDPPNVREYLLTEEVTSYVNPDSCVLMHCKADHSWAQHQLKKVTEVNSKVRYSEADLKLWSNAKVLDVAVTGYSCANPLSEKEAGIACGSVLFDTSTLKILGILSASSKAKLWFNAFTAEQCESILGGTTFKARDIEYEEVRAASNIVKVEKHESQSLSLTTPAMKTYHSTKSTIRKSKCHEEFGPVVRSPCNLSQNGDNGQTAVVKGLLNYVPHQPFPERDMISARDDITHMFLDNCRPIIEVVSKRTLYEAVCGVPQHIPRLTMSTGPGLPWSLYADTKRKSDLLVFNDEHELIGVHKDLDKMIKLEEELMKNDQKPMTIFQISLKDERLKLEKLNNVRLIQGSPLSLTISARKYLMDFNYAFQCNNWRLEHAVGINVQSIEWDALARSLLDFSPYICVGDFSKFGPRLLTEFVRNCSYISNKWYEQFESTTDEDQRVREQLGERAINCKNLAFDQLIELSCGSPSGAIDTVIKNSICNMQYIRCAWIGIMRERNPKLSGLHHFKTYVKFICYGDDVIFSVKEEVIDLFNNETISEYFARFGVKYTDADKDGAIRKYCSLEEATFLKCGFKLYRNTAVNDGIWICQPDVKDIIDTTNWVRKPKGTPQGANLDHVLDQAAITNCEDAIKRMWFHGEERFKEFQSKVQAFWRAQNSPCTLRYFSFEGLQTDYGFPLKGESYAYEDLLMKAYIQQNGDLEAVAINEENDGMYLETWSNPQAESDSRKCSHNQYDERDCEKGQYKEAIESEKCLNTGVNGVNVDWVRTPYIRHSDTIS
jgi:hypothetical protein